MLMKDLLSHRNLSLLYTIQDILFFTCMMQYIHENQCSEKDLLNPTNLLIIQTP